MEFEFDEPKSQANKLKHGIDFVEAQALWEDELRLVEPARSEREQRYILVGTVDGKYWSAFFTYRGERIRLISVRRARREEVFRYGP